MNKQGKRYLITYTDGSISATKAEGILGIAKSANMKVGIAALAAKAAPSDKDVLHFENLGVTAMVLSEEEAKKLSKQKEILAVEEDIEVFAEDSHESDDEQYRRFFINNEDNERAQEVNAGLYVNGYNKALLDVFASVLTANTNKYQDADAATVVGPGPIPPLPIPLPNPLPPLPNPFPIPGPLPRPILVCQPRLWNTCMVKAPTAWGRGLKGNGVKVAVLDTGIAAHPDLQISGGVSFIAGSTSYEDKNGHGTHCAGIIAARNESMAIVGVAPDVSLYAVKVLGDNGRGFISGIIAGMEWCILNGIQVMSMSLTSTIAPNVAYANAIKRCQDNGVTAVAAAGNHFGTNFPWVNAPANSVISGDPNASPIAVGAVDSERVIASFSSRGGQSNNWNQVSCVAPGKYVLSTGIEMLPNNLVRFTYLVKSGTSMATPHVAGLAALIIQKNPGITPYNVKKRIMATSTDLGPNGPDLTYGYGLINFDAATK